MRRGLAGLILGLSLVVASVSWAGFVMGRTVLDPGRSERLADQILDNETLRAALVGRLSDGLGAALPANVPIPRQDLELAADRALEDPRVDALLRDGVVRVHQNALEGNAEPVAIDATALGAATRDSLIQLRPELESVVPAAPPVIIELPTGGLSWLGTVRRTVQRFTLVLALLAVAGATTALVVAKNRPAVLRRVSTWAFGTAAFWLVVGYGIPFLAKTVAPTSTAIVAAVIDVFFGAMIQPAIAMAVFGVLLLGLSFLWSSVAARQPARLLQPTPAGADPAGRSVRRSTGRTTSNIRSGQVPTPYQPEAPPSAQSPPAQSPPAQSPPVHRPPAGPVPEPTQVLPTAHPGQTTRPAAEHPGHAEQPPAGPRRWVEGIGYVEDPA